MLAPLRRRWRRWWEARHPRSDTLLLTQRNVYILPTRAGWLFAATLLVLLVASINYQLSLGFVLTFLLAGSGIVSMHVTHATLRGLALHLRPLAAVHAGDAAALEVVLASEATRPRYGVGLRLRESGQKQWIWVDIAAGGQSTARLSFVARHRGRVDLPSVVLETRFPLGLFRAWAEWRPASTLLAWPRAEAPATALPPARALGGAAASLPSRGGEEFDGVRAYRRGDPLKLVVWKKVARTGGSELIARDTRGSQRSELWLDWAATGSLAPEDRLSRLAGWLLAAERAGLAWGLRLPGTELAPGAGETQRRAGLEALALWRT
ncbi:DUF58 domain-containing protein [Rivibacter subsaxonicus]|uniref:Uncharacterized protein (DUF58 family) n=1 Tax=Rivibacter subsaxonicus TaxID=457575 RepID=A0A4Q7VNU9_9BURK|nr:DUF58 domain-containing protein [Rivibacter subsaxonicus]RZT98012.1 uncharacterized protein (DUF58 family) [Rivibacter subsaxonicus]